MDKPEGPEDRIEKKITQVLESIITVFFFAILSLTILLVILRYVFNSSITGGNELIEYLFIYTTAVGAATAISRREHIKISYFLEKMSVLPRIITEVFGLLLIAFINIVIAWLSFAWIMKVGASESPVIRLPMWAVQISVPIGTILAVLYCLFDIYKIISHGVHHSREGETV
ncbi:MAG: TRAP transporter small permease [Spirochaetia bacterium]